MNWKEQLANLLVVILGITIAFYLEGWREGRSKRNLEQQYLQALRQDLLADKDLLDTLIKIDESRLDKLTKISSASIGQYEHLDSIGLFMAYIQFHVPFEPQTASFEAMTSSGIIDIIRSFELRTQIFQLHSQWYRGISQFDNAIMQHTNQFIRPFSIYEVEHYSAFEVNPDFLNKPSFRNMIFSYQSLFETRLNYYKEVLSALEELINEIESNHLKSNNPT